MQVVMYAVMQCHCLLKCGHYSSGSYHYLPTLPCCSNRVAVLPAIIGDQHAAIAFKVTESLWKRAEVAAFSKTQRQGVTEIKAVQMQRSGVTETRHTTARWLTPRRKGSRMLLKRENTFMTTLSVILNQGTCDAIAFTIFTRNLNGIANYWQQK